MWTSAFSMDQISSLPRQRWNKRFGVHFSYHLAIENHKLKKQHRPLQINCLLYMVLEYWQISDTQIMYVKYWQEHGMEQFIKFLVTCRNNHIIWHRADKHKVKGNQKHFSSVFIGFCVCGMVFALCMFTAEHVIFSCSQLRGNLAYMTFFPANVYHVALTCGLCMLHFLSVLSSIACNST